MRVRDQSDDHFIVSPGRFGGPGHDPCFSFCMDTLWYWEVLLNSAMERSWFKATLYLCASKARYAAFGCLKGAGSCFVRWYQSPGGVKKTNHFSWSRNLRPMSSLGLDSRLPTRHSMTASLGIVQVDWHSLLPSCTQV